MTPQNQIKALAELDGWRLDWHNAQGENWIKPNGDIVTFWTDNQHNVDSFPNYLTSYDAIIPLVQKQPDSVLVTFEAHQNNNVSRDWWKATPAQLCEALLRATGRWRE